MGFGLIGSKVTRGSVHLSIWLSGFYFTSCILAVTLVPSFRLTRPFLGDELLDQEFLWNAVKVPKQTSNGPSKSTVSYRNNIRADDERLGNRLGICFPF